MIARTPSTGRPGADDGPQSFLVLSLLASSRPICERRRRHETFRDEHNTNNSPHHNAIISTQGFQHTEPTVLLDGFKSPFAGSSSDRTASQSSRFLLFGPLCVLGLVQLTTARIPPKPLGA